MGGGVAWVGRGSGAAVVAGGAVDVGWPLVVGGASVEVVSDVIRGIVSSGDASRESAHAVVDDHDERSPSAPARLQRRTRAWVRTAMPPVSARRRAMARSSPKRCLVHCGAVPSKRLIVLTGLAVVAGGVMAMSAVGGGDGGDPQRLEPLPDHPPADVASTPLSSPPSTADVADTSEPVESSVPSTCRSTSTSTTTTTIHPDLVARAYPVDPAVNSSFTAGGPRQLPGDRHLRQLGLRDGVARTGDRCGRRSAAEYLG